MFFFPHVFAKTSGIFWKQKALWTIFVFVVAFFSLAPARAQSVNTPIRIDASQPYSEATPALYAAGSATSPSGTVLGVNSRFLTIDGKPWLPAMGEFHFSRYPQAQWEEEILKMKAAGINIVATYVIWIHHEEIEGQFDWTDQRDLRVFAELCAKHGMYLVVRIGPWDHAEARNGGLPDWVLKQGPTRVNDPVYLASVRAWYGQIGAQLKGLLWKDGGPVIGIQLENEYAKRGPDAGIAHILELKKIALASGLDAPFYLITGWDNAVVPQKAVLPLYGGYPAAPWDDSIVKLPPADIYAFRFHSRVAAANDAIGQSEAFPHHSDLDQLPFLTAEIGGGIEDTYHRRPIISPDSIAAIFPVMLGSGVNLYGTYMFQGGENPDGKLTTLQESQATGYPNDLPIKSYDFQAPLGEFGDERASLRKLKVFHYFLNDFGSDLAPMIVHAPESEPCTIDDLSVPRASVRSRGDAGFIFFNNYLRGYTMPTWHAAQFEIRLPAVDGKAAGTLSIPRHPVDLPSGSYFIWPFNFRSEGVNLRYGTAQLFTRLVQRGVTTLYFEAIPGIPVEFAFESATVRSIKTSSGETTRSADAIYISGIKPGVNSWIDIVSAQGKTIRLVALTAEEAENAWKARIGGEDRLLITSADFFADTEANPARIWLRSRSDANFAFTVMPPVASLKANLPLATTEKNALSIAYAAQAKARKVALDIHQTQAAGLAPPVKIGPPHPQGVAVAPDAGDLPHAARWTITLPAHALDGLSELYLQTDYQGDVARFSADSHLLTDNFYNGQTWTIGLRRFLDRQSSRTFELSILPLRKDAPVYFELTTPPPFTPDGQIVKLNRVRLIPEYQLELGSGSESAEPK